MPVDLTANEARVIGCLMEKSVVTPDQYPLTLNTLTNACNQKSSRHPVMSMEPGAVQATVRSLEAKHFLRTEENFKTQVEKYTQRLCNTPFSDYTFDEPQFAIMCVLLLRGARTPGELRSNSARLHSFRNNSAVVEALTSLIEREGGPIVVELPRTPGRKDSEFMHLLSGPIELESLTVEPTPAPAAGASAKSELGTLEQRVTALEAMVEDLQRQISTDN